MPKVSLIENASRRNAVEQALSDLGTIFSDKIRVAKNIFIKVDLGHHELQLAATHLDAVRGVIDAIRQYSYAPITIGDASHYGTKAGFRNFGYTQLEHYYPGITLCDLQDDVTRIIPITHFDGSELEIPRPQTVFEAEVRITVGGLKTHHDYALQGVVASWAEGTWIVPSRQSVNGRVFTRAPWLHAHGSQAMYHLLASIYQSLPPHFAVIDGTLGMEGNGPVEGRAVPMGVALASAWPVALDTVAATLMGLDPSEIGYLSLLGAASPELVTIGKIDVPADLLVRAARKFAPPHLV